MSGEALHVATPRGSLYARRWRAPHESAATIVLWHDSLGCVALWRDFPAALAAATRCDVVAYDRLGFGRSDPHPGKLASDFVRDEATRDFAALRDALGIGRFIAFGHSVGGGMAICAAAAFPEDCVALVTESAQAFVEDVTLAGIRNAQAAFARPGEVDRLAKYHGDKAAWVLDAWIGTWLAPEFAAFDVDDELRRVRCPVLVMHGDQDEFGSERHPVHIAALTAPHSTLRLLPECGHVPHRERPEEILALVAVWLGAIRR